MKSLKILGAFAALAIGVLSCAPAQAQATRTWVSGVGDDANPCSRTAPCKTFAGAISKTAAGGEISVLDPGGFGAVTITKAMTIDGGGGPVASILVAGTNGINVNAGANDIVTLRNIEIQGAAQSISQGVTGVKFNTGGSLVLDNVRIMNFTAFCVDFEPNQAGASTLTIDRSVLSNCGGGGVLVKPAGGSVKASLTNVSAQKNKYGLRVEDNAAATVFDSTMSNSASNGVIAVSTAAASEVNIEKSAISNNSAFGVLAAGPGAVARIAQNGIFDNLTGVGSMSGGVIFSYGNNQIAGNGTDVNPAPTSVANQ